MTRTAPHSFIRLDDHSATPKYRQLVNSIIQAVQSGKLKKDDVLPSINELSFEYEISRDTAEKGYKHYVIIPHFIEGGEKAFEVINTIDKDKLIILDKLVPGVTGEFKAVYENFEKDIFTALEQALERLQKYREIRIVFPENSYYPV